MLNTKRSDVLVITPAWNESESVGNTVREIAEWNPTLDILVIDDGSEDNTGKVARMAGAQVLVLPFNLGVGGAMRAGFKFAVAHGYSFVIQVDADGQHNPQDIGRVLKGLEVADISIGARFADEGSYEVRGPRKWAMKFLAVTISRLARTKLTDVTSGFRAANQKALTQYLEHYPAEYLGDTIDSLVVAVRSGCTVTQIPVSMRKRQGGIPSNAPLKAALYLARSFLALLFALMRQKPLARREEGAII